MRRTWSHFLLRTNGWALKGTPPEFVPKAVVKGSLGLDLDWKINLSSLRLETQARELNDVGPNSIMEDWAVLSNNT